MDDAYNQHHATNKGRVAFVDLLFSWPPNGGADVDLYHVVSTLSRQGVDARVFVVQFAGIPGRGQVSPDEMPFQVEPIAMPQGAQSHESIAKAVRRAVDAWAPSVVFLMHGYALKPWVALELSHYPLVGRYYAHELLCARNALRFKDRWPCPNDYLREPEHCRRCALTHLGPEIKSGEWRAWTQDYVAAGAYASDYYRIYQEALDSMTRIIVSNEQLRGELGRWKNKAMVVPGGIHPEQIPFHDTHSIEKKNDPKTIFMAGRAEDPTKGLDVLLAAGQLLWTSKRDDFRVLATHFDARQHNAFFTSTGWLTHEETLARYGDADLCVVPSIWHEPFGLVALEAMAAGLPVCASDIGGLRDIVVHGETGFLFDPGDVAGLSQYLIALLDNRELRIAMGRAGRHRAVTQFSWDVVIQRHYLPLLTKLQQHSATATGEQIHE